MEGTQPFARSACLLPFKQSHSIASELGSARLSTRHSAAVWLFSMVASEAGASGDLT